MFVNENLFEIHPYTFYNPSKFKIKKILKYRIVATYNPGSVSAVKNTSPVKIHQFYGRLVEDHTKNEL